MDPRSENGESLNRDESDEREGNEETGSSRIMNVFVSETNSGESLLNGDREEEATRTNAGSRYEGWKEE